MFITSIKCNIIDIASHTRHITSKKALWKRFLKMTPPFITSITNKEWKQQIPFLLDRRRHLWLLERDKGNPEL